MSNTLIIKENLMTEELNNQAEQAEFEHEAPVQIATKKGSKKVFAVPTAEPEANFDWDAIAKGKPYNDQQMQEMESKYDTTLSTIQDREVVDGIVISLNKREVVVNIGYKSDGIVSLNEFRYNPDLKIGDVVEVYVENQEDKKGQLILSHKKARASRSWERVNEALENKE